MHLFENDGYCACCRSTTVFRAYGEWLRDTYLCTRCHSVPRQRALHRVLDAMFCNWQSRGLHESSPSNDFLARGSSGYSSSQFLPGTPPGATVDGIRCEDLERLTFADGTFDLFVTQDVLEHVFRPDLAAREVMRVLRPGGAHVFTAPKHPGLRSSYRRAERVGEVVKHLVEPDYHANPVGDGKALVTWDYGSDFERLISSWSGAAVETHMMVDRALGLDGEYLEVFVVRKPEHVMSAAA